MNNEYYLRDSIYPIIETAMKNKNNLRKLLVHISNYFDYNTEKIQTPYPSERLYFLYKDHDALYDAIDSDKTTINNIVQKMPMRYFGTHDPANIVFTLLIRYCELNKLPKEKSMIMTYYGCYMYVLKQSKYFPFGANESIMEYMVSELSDKFLIKKLGSVYKMIEHLAAISDDNYHDDLINASDKDISDYTSGIDARFNDVWKNIKDEFEKAHRSKAYINYDSDKIDDDGARLADNNSFVISRTVDEAMISLTRNINLQFADQAARTNNVSANEIRNAVRGIVKNNYSELKEFFDLMIGLFLDDTSNKAKEINTNKFFVYSIQIYKKSNTINDKVLRIKIILGNWLKAYSNTYAKSNNVSTIANFKKALYTFFVLHVRNI